VPLVLMGYANPMIARGSAWFADACADAGVDGMICVDIPAEEDAELGPALREHGISFIRLATPTTDAARLPAVLEGSSGFLYYVSVAGITGKQQAQLTSIEQAVAHLKSGTDLPVVVGFGVRTPEQAADIAQHGDGVVVGSAMVDLSPSMVHRPPARCAIWSPASLRRCMGPHHFQSGLTRKTAHELAQPRSQRSPARRGEAQIPDNLWIKCPLRGDAVHQGL
jgi:hypothetical protein